MTCPKCGAPTTYVEPNSYVCLNGHTTSGKGS